MPMIEVIGGVKAELKIEVDEKKNIVDISPGDVFDGGGGGDSDPFDVGDDKKDDLLTVGQRSDELNLLDPKQDLKGPINDHPPNRAIKEEKDSLVNRTGVQTSNNYKDNFKTEVSKQIQGNLVLNYNANRAEVHESSNREKIQENNKLIPWSDIYRTREGTSVTEDYHKVQKNNVPTSYVFASEYNRDDSGKFSCNHCQFSTSCKKYVTKHIRRKHREITTTYSCPYCPFVSKYQLTYHLINMHRSESELNWFRCNQCDYKSKLKTQLTTHILTHLDPYQMMDRMRKCDKCPKMYKDTKSLRRHKLLIHERDKLKKLKCVECDYESYHTHQLSHHMNVCHFNNEHLETQQCPKCNYRTKVKQHFKQHLAMAHREKSLQCEKCAYRCVDRDHMNLHLINHKETKDEADLKYRCDKCDYKTYRFYSLRVHKLNHLKPEEIQFFYCYHCKFKAKRKDNLKTHIFRHFKQDEVPFPCYICDFTSNKRHLLIKHIGKHAAGMLNEMESDEEIENTKINNAKVTKVVLRTSKRINQKINGTHCTK